MIGSVAEFRGQERLRSLLARYLAQGRLSGTLLLLGQRGLGKTTLATIIARALCCANNQPSGAAAHAGSMFAADEVAPTSPPPGLDFCGECYACRSIATGNQPEFVTVRPKGQDIKVEQIDEELDGLRSASLHPVNLPWRVFLFDDAHFLNRDTSNQLLKLLEEPPARTVFILTTDQPEKLLPTIRSRGVPFSLSPLARWQLEEYIRESLPEADTRAVREAARMAGGRFVDALALAASAEWRAAVLSLAQALAIAEDIPERAAELQEHEFAAMWAKELRETGLEEEAALKQTEKPRINELKRQALCLAFDRAAWQLLADAARGMDHYEGEERRGRSPAVPRRGFGHALALFKQRVNANVDQQLAQLAMEAALQRI